LYRNLRIYVEAEPRLPINGLAIRLDWPAVRGLVLYAPSAPNLRGLIAHEVGHIIAGATYGLETVFDHARYWHVNEAERIATEVGVSLLLDIDDLLPVLTGEETAQQLARRHGMSIRGVEARMVIAFANGDMSWPYHILRPPDMD
jgi:predicted Zn-dependent protease